ncbi:MAG: hypothetical protein F6K65_32030 [Moorea sp. SIO3C2]|nr:hypothetical protein [Moorena sp. SIO3C2]
MWEVWEVWIDGRSHNTALHPLENKPSNPIPLLRSYLLPAPLLREPFNLNQDQLIYKNRNAENPVSLDRG